MSEYMICFDIREGSNTTTWYFFRVCSLLTCAALWYCIFRDRQLDIYEIIVNKLIIKFTKIYKHNNKHLAYTLFIKTVGKFAKCKEASLLSTIHKICSKGKIHCSSWCPFILKTLGYALSHSLYCWELQSFFKKVYFLNYKKILRKKIMNYFCFCNFW